MKNIILSGIVIFCFLSLGAQDKDKAVFKEYNMSESFYYNTIKKDLNDFEASKNEKKPYKRLKLAIDKQKFPNKIELYENKLWHQPPVSQGSTGTCWCFSTTSFFESEVKRLYNKEVKLSELYTVYWEYVEKAISFVETRGETIFEEGSESNAVTKLYGKYGIVLQDSYSGLTNGRKFHAHDDMYEEMNNYLKSVKEKNAWDLEAVKSTIKSIMNHHIGEPPVEVEVDGEKYTPRTFLMNYLKLNMEDYVEILSYMQEPYYTKCVYDVPDNWWSSDEYNNVPLDVYMDIVKQAVDKGYSFVIGGDVSEPGLLTSKGDPQIAVVPSFDIPSAYIDENARQFRFSNKTTTDDHGMHVVGSYKNSDGYWFLVKDSGSGSRNNGKESKEFGYYFFHEDYVKLKMMEFTIHKDMVEDILKKIK